MKRMHVSSLVLHIHMYMYMYVVISTPATGLNFKFQKLGAEVDVSTLEDRIFVLKTQDNAVSTNLIYMIEWRDGYKSLIHLHGLKVQSLDFLITI